MSHLIVQDVQTGRFCGSSFKSSIPIVLNLSLSCQQFRLSEGTRHLCTLENEINYLRNYNKTYEVVFLLSFLKAPSWREELPTTSMYGIWTGTASSKTKQRKPALKIGITFSSKCAPPRKKERNNDKLARGRPKMAVVFKRNQTSKKQFLVAFTQRKWTLI